MRNSEIAAALSELGVILLMFALGLEFSLRKLAQVASTAGVTALIQPGGSKRDAEVIDAVSAADAAMVLTGRRHFRH